jgi:hypothetical protein
VNLEIEKVPLLDTFGPAANTYMVWSVSPEGFFESMGELDSRGRLQATTRFEQFGMLVTAEPHYMVDRPSSLVAFRSGNPKSADIRRITVPVQVGEYEYSKIQFPPREAVPAIVLQARYALQIAKSFEAQRYAEPEVRQAQIAADTMEEMIRRSTPLEIVTPAANEAIRRSQLALKLTRERATLVALDASRNEANALREDKRQLESRVEEFTKQQSAAEERIRRIESDLSAVRRETQQLSQERDRAASRVRDLEKELAELKQKQNSLQENLTVRLHDDFIDTENGGLSLAGRDTLLRTLNFAAVIGGPIRIEGPASDAVFEAAQKFLVEGGIPQNRIVIRR